MTDRKAKRLTALEVERLKYEPLTRDGAKRSGPYRVSDRDGLYIAVLESGVKSWRHDYKLHGRRVIVYGTYPVISLEKARDLHIDAKRLIAAGTIPAVHNSKIVSRAESLKAKNAGDNRFKSVGQEWYAAKLKKSEKSKSWKENYTRWLEWCYDAFGGRPLPEIEAADVLALVKKIEAEGKANSAEHCRQLVASVFDYGIKNQRAPHGFNPARAIQGAVFVPDPKHRPKLDVKELPAFLKAIDTHEREDMQLALKLLLHTFTRKNELAEAPWSEIDFDAALWSIPASRMKKRRDHTVPLTAQTLAMFRRLRELSGDSPFVLPSPVDKKRHTHRNALNDALKKIGYDGEKFTPHGARGTAASILSDAGWSKEVVKKQLAHDVDKGTDRAYFRNTLLQQRRNLMRAWSDTLDGLAAGGNVVPIGAGRAA
jgi:integrase